MKKHILTLSLILAVLIAAAFLPNFVPTVQAIGSEPNILTEPPQPDPASNAVSANPVVQIIVGMFATLFAILTFVPYLWQESSQDGAIRLDPYHD